MIVVLIGAFTVAGVGIGWLGYKANLRIAAWGEAMNEIDGIFQVAEGTGSEHPVIRSADEGRAKPSFSGQRLPAGPAASR